MEELHPHVSCTAGRGACPEEDSGGVWEYEDMKEDGEINATDFDVEEVSKGVEELPYDGYEPW